MSIEMNRRSFLKGAAAAGAAAAVAGLAACSPAKTEGAPAEGAKEEVIKVGETLECDICVVGAGIAGLAASVQAAYNGAKVILLEAAGKTGGNGNGIGGLFAVHSKLQEELGIESPTFDELIVNEMNASQFRTDARIWKSLYDNSAANYDWLVEQGVIFSGQVDDYGTGGFKTMHYYEGTGGVGYVPPMTAKAEELGVEIICDTAAKHAVIENGTVVGVQAVNTKDEWIQVNAKSVILASGGFGGDFDMVTRIGYKKDNLWYYGVPTNIGDGYRIGMEAGAKDMSYQAADNAHGYIKALPHEGPVDMPNCMLSFNGLLTWVNQNGRRFTREDCGMRNFCLANASRWDQEAFYFIWNLDVYDKVCEMCGVEKEKGRTILAESVETNAEETLFEADNWADIAKVIGVDPDALTEEMEKYNKYCEQGKDEEYAKDPMWLMPMTEPPFYVAKPHTLFLMSIGAVATNEYGQAVTDECKPIPGLYAIGTDGCMLYRNVYTIDAPASCCGNSVNMARMAANHACGLI